MWNLDFMRKQGVTLPAVRDVNAAGPETDAGSSVQTPRPKLSATPGHSGTVRAPQYRSTHTPPGDHYGPQCSSTFSTVSTFGLSTGQTGPLMGDDWLN
jgi:hypothetical protein